MSHPVLRRRHQERAERLEVARRWAATLRERINVEAAVVVGSVARGDFNKWSDIDVLVIAAGLPANGRERLALLQADAPAGVQAVAWSSAELAQRRRRGDPIAVEADRVGVVVFGALP